MPRAPEQVKTALTAAIERRRALHARMVAGEISVAQYRSEDAREVEWIDALLERLTEALATAGA